jgi:tRNA(Ile)-lysidine synthase
MKNALLYRVKHFLKNKLTGEKPVLVGFSGGSDSTALLHLVQDFNIHVAHVDHGWRPESGVEAELLRKRVKHPFYLLKATKGFHDEAGAREERFRLFSHLYQELGCQALLLAHHGDDQSETVFKRILEGAHPTSLGGILPETEYMGMRILRPLLDVTKKEILEWLEEEGITGWIEDASNLDTKYLRARMRQEILPDLSQKFGKEVSGNLRRLGNFSQELSDYLHRKIQVYFGAIKKRGDEEEIDLSPFFPLEPLEIKTFLKVWAAQNEIMLSHESLETLYNLVHHTVPKRINERITVQERVIAIKISNPY